MSAFSLLISPMELSLHLYQHTERFVTAFFRHVLSVNSLSPYTFLAHECLVGQANRRPVIYYDFLKGWPIPSPPSGCLNFHTSLIH